MTVVINRRGRKRKTGLRHPSGDIRIPDRDDPCAAVLAQPHRRYWPIIRDKRGRTTTDMRRDQRAESPHGVLLLAKVITQGQYEAGERYRADHLRYLAAIEARDSLANYSGGAARVVPDETQRRWVSNFEAALAALDRRSAPVIGRVLLRSQPMTAVDLTDYRRGLMRLAEHYGFPDAGMPAPRGQQGDGETR